MRKPMADRLATILYLAYALPALRARSDEAAALVEAAIAECTLAISGRPSASAEQLDVAAYLGYAVDDVAAIAPVGAGLLGRAVGLLEDGRPNVHAVPNVLH